MDKLNITAENGVKTIEVLTGNAAPQREARRVIIVGNIDSVSRFVSSRKAVIDALKTNVQVDREALTIELVKDEDNYFSSEVTGKLQIHPMYEKFKINTGHEWQHRKLAEFIKMNRSAFRDREVAMLLSSGLQNIEVRVSKEYEKSDNNRGDYKAMVRQKVIKSNIPESFKLFVPIFKGEPKQEINVELYVNPDSYEVTLVSADANDVTESVRDSVIDTQIDAISKEIPEILIVEK